MSSPCSACLPQASGPAASAAHPDRWAGVSSLSLGVFALVTAEFLPASLLTAMATDLGVTDGAAGQAVTATALVAAVAAPVIPLATQRMDRKRVLLALTSLLLASNVRWSSVAGGALIAVLALALLAIASGAVGGGLLVDRV
ncbi:MAG TPA: MFS transporter, partial [Ramlibacter sp.]|nr:MFS transporter [Ramlibacter sp.]